MTYDEKIEWIGYLGEYLFNCRQIADFREIGDPDTLERLPLVMSVWIAEVDAARSK